MTAPDPADTPPMAARKRSREAYEQQQGHERSTYWGGNLHCIN